jgi:epoxide hydrolase 4
MRRNGFDEMHIAKQQANSVTGSPESVREERARRGGSAQLAGARRHDRGSAPDEARSAAVDRRRFLLAAGGGVAGAIGMNNVTAVREASAAGEVPPSYRVPTYRDLYRGKWEELTLKGSDTLHGRKVLHPEEFKHYTVMTRDPRGYDVKFHYVREGSGEPLIMFHGWPGFWWDYWMNIKELANHFDVIVVDMRGYGDTDKPGYDPKTNRIQLDPVDHYDLNTTVDDQMRVARALGIEKAYWVGHDWSSLTMHKFVRRYPEMVKKLVLSNPFLPGAEARYMSPAFHSHSYYASFHSTPLATELVGSSREATKIYFRWFFNWWSANKALWTPEEIEIITDNFVKPGNVEGGFSWYRANLSPAARGWEPRDYEPTHIPTLCLWGEGDTCVVIDWSDLVPQYYLNLKYVPVSNAGHFTMREAPDVFNREVISFLKQA